MTAMTRTIYLSVRGDGAWRVLEAFRRELGEEAATLVVHPSRDENGFYGSADVADPAAAREAFARARQPYPTLRAHLSAPSPESEESARRQPVPDARRPQPRPQHRPAGGGESTARSEHGARGDGHGGHPGQQAPRDQQGDRGQDRRTARRRRRPAR